VGGVHAPAPARHARRHPLRRGGLREPLQRRRPDRADLRLPAEPPLRPASQHLPLDPGAARRRGQRAPCTTCACTVRLTNDGVHGGPFRYRSILTDVLAWAAAEVTGTRFPDLFSRVIWSRIGAERDAEVIVDAAGFAVVEVGICTTLRDLARFGVMHLNDGAAGEERVVPAAWIARLLERDEALIAAYDRDLLGHLPNAFYHDQWWVWAPAAGLHSGSGH